MYKVVIVEDEDIIRKGIIFMVDWLKAGCVVAGEAADGEEGLARIREVQPDIVITDVKMPVKDGLQMLEASIDSFGYEAIIISGYSEFAYAKKAISLNVTEYLLKPIDFDHLYRTLEKLTAKIAVKRQWRAYLQTQKNSAVLPDPALLSETKCKYTGKMLAYIQTFYREKISIADLSRQFRRSGTYLNAKFKKETGCTFNDFLNRYRVLQAVDLLQQGGLRMYEIAEAVGFQDYKYFIQVFKKYIGCSPGKFAARLER
ncbi:MAG: helix-turn-helix domain-containing protein [Sporomusaceae bacterium]|nr:helix-turn-helix domain-containing protein [Sporomusaceae bacterium]